MSSLSSNSSLHSVMTDREAKKLEKVLAQEAKADQKAIDRAMKDVKAAEKALKKCTEVRRACCISHIPPSLRSRRPTRHRRRSSKRKRRNAPLRRRSTRQRTSMPTYSKTRPRRRRSSRLAMPPRTPEFTYPLHHPRCVGADALSRMAKASGHDSQHCLARRG